MGQSAGENLGLDNITFARKAEAFGKDRERPPQGHPGHDFVAWQVRMLMHDIAALGMLIRLPPSLHDLQRRPPRAIEKVVQERERKEVRHRSFHLDANRVLWYPLASGGRSIAGCGKDR